MCNFEVPKRDHFLKNKGSGQAMSPTTIISSITRFHKHLDFLKRLTTIKTNVNCDAPFPRGPLTTRQPAEYSWISGNSTLLTKIG